MPMKLILCVDEKGGFSFFGKRQSRDKILINEILKETGGNLFIDEYSACLFSEFKDVKIIKDISEAASGYFFAEGHLPSLDSVGEIILYCWNRHYPADVFFSVDERLFALEYEQEFKGFSHEKITQKIYRRKLP